MNEAVEAQALAKNRACIHFDNPGPDGQQFISIDQKDASPVYGVRKNQSFYSLPNVDQPTNPNGMGELLRAIVNGPSRSTSVEVMAALNSNTGAGGGYTIGSQLYGSVIDLAMPKIALSQLGMGILNLTSNEMTLPKLTGRPTPEVKLEGEKFAESDATFSAIHVVPRVFGFMIKVSHELLSDSKTIEATLTNTIADAMTIGIDKAGIVGTGDSGEAEKINGLADLASEDALVPDGEWLSWDNVAQTALFMKLLDQEPSGILLNTSDHDGLLRSKDTQGRWLGPPPSLDKTQYVQSTSVPADIGYVGDFTKYYLALRDSLQIEVVRTGDDAERLMWTFIVHWRGNYCLTDSTAIMKMYRGEAS